VAGLLHEYVSQTSHEGLRVGHELEARLLVVIVEERCLGMVSDDDCLLYPVHSHHQPEEPPVVDQQHDLLVVLLKLGPQLLVRQRETRVHLLNVECHVVVVRPIPEGITSAILHERNYPAVYGVHS
jgi:hypothetical protein